MEGARRNDPATVEMNAIFIERLRIRKLKSREIDRGSGLVRYCDTSGSRPLFLAVFRAKEVCRHAAWRLGRRVFSWLRAILRNSILEIARARLFSVE